MHIPLLTTLISLATQAPLLDALSWLLELPRAIADAYGSSVRWGVDFARDLFEDYGYWVVFFGTLSENTLLVGLIVPGAIVVILAGIAAQDGSISLPVAYLLGLAGTIIGDTLSYCMGRFGWTRFRHFSVFKDVDEKVRKPLLEKGVMFVLLYHFAGYTRVVGPTAAGFLKMPYREWAIVDHAGAALWIAGYMGIGYALGAAGFTLDSSQSYFRYVEWALLVLVFFSMWSLYRNAEKAWSPKKDPGEDEAASARKQPESIL
jgi:membrane protein DedA with SNARE-associated domain